MKILLLTLVLLLTLASVVWAACTTTTYFLPDGRMMVCMTCCSYGNCSVTCF